MKKGGSIKSNKFMKTKKTTKKKYTAPKIAKIRRQAVAAGHKV